MLSIAFNTEAIGKPNKYHFLTFYLDCKFNHEQITHTHHIILFCVLVYRSLFRLEKGLKTK